MNIVLTMIVYSIEVIRTFDLERLPRTLLASIWASTLPHSMNWSIRLRIELSCNSCSGRFFLFSSGVKLVHSEVRLYMYLALNIYMLVGEVIYRVFIKYCVFSKDFKIFRTLAFLCFPLVSVCVHTTGR